MSEPPVPVLRASDADRERVAGRLRRAAGDGELTFDELDDRLNEAYAARTLADLEPLTADLQVVSTARSGEPGGFTVRRGPGGARWLVAIMSTCERRGRWRLADRCISLNIMGSSELDLNQAELASDHVELAVYSIMGGATIRVPHGLRVVVSEFALMGANSVDVAEPHPPSEGPVLHLRLLSVMGGVDVKRGPKRSRCGRKALDRHLAT